jgi:type II secretory pathway pseudopilin PulG
LLGSSLDQYRLDNGTYPTSLDELQQKPAAAANWNGPYLKKAVPNDPWGFPYKFKFPGQFGNDPGRRGRRAPGGRARTPTSSMTPDSSRSGTGSPSSARPPLFVIARGGA